MTIDSIGERKMYQAIINCLCCNGTNLVQVLDLGNQPLANSYPVDLQEENRFPLQLNFCADCYHLQLSAAVEPDLLFKNYLYVSGTTETLRNYFDEFAKLTLQFLPKAKTVLDIACNDGSQLNSFKKLGIQTYGVDPAENLYSLSSDQGHSIYCNYFDSSFAEKLNMEFDIITAQNVFAHNSDPFGFLVAASKMMGPESLLFIQTSQANMIINNEFDTIYHEHISFFNTNSLKTVVERAGLHLVKVFKTPIHGTSYVFVISKSKPSVDNVKDTLSEESQKGLYSLSKYSIYSDNCNRIAKEYHECINKYKNQGIKCVGYGAAAKGTVFLNFSNTSLDVVIDDNPLKWGRYMPGVKTPICGPEYLSNCDPDKTVITPLAWNFFDEITRRVQNHLKNTTYIRYFPSLKIEKI